MATEIKIFDNPQFGEIRTIINEDGKLFFVASDVAKALGYAIQEGARRNDTGKHRKIILITTITHGIHPMPCDALLNIAMERINAIMDNIRDSPVCPESGETNLLYIIIKHIWKKDLKN